jgi:hypothetical protein
MRVKMYAFIVETHYQAAKKNNLIGYKNYHQLRACKQKRQAEKERRFTKNVLGLQVSSLFEISGEVSQ